MLNIKQPGYIFIVGLPRTGTTLTRNILNCSMDVGIGGESKFLGGPRYWGLLPGHGYRERFAKVGDISTDAGVNKVVDYIYSIPEDKRYWGKLAKKVDRERFLQSLLESDRSDRALLDVAMALYANSRPLGGEKTPAHIYWVPILLKWFPSAKIIHTFRDPRAIYVSLTRKHKKRLGSISELYASFQIIIEWHHVIRLHHQYQQHYPNNYYFLKYEDLISDSKTSLQTLCDFLEVSFSEAMLKQTTVNSSFVPRDQIQGFDTQAIDRWRKHLHPVVQQWMVLWCKKQLLEFGYRV